MNDVIQSESRVLFQLDQMANPGLSKQQLQQEKARSRKRQQAKKAKKKARAQAGDGIAEDETVEGAEDETSEFDHEAGDGVRKEK